MNVQKEALQAIREINSRYGLKESSVMLSMYKCLIDDYIDGTNVKLANYLNEKFNMHKDDVASYIQKLNQLDFFKLKKIFGDKHSVLVPDVLLDKFAEKLDAEKPQKVLITECEKFEGRIVDLIRDNTNVQFMLTCSDNEYKSILDYVFKDLHNVVVVSANIYEYGFINEKFDLILTVPTFGTRDKINNTDFISRQLDLVALENLLLHLRQNSELFIVLSAGFTFGGGDKQDLRRFILDMYNVEEISELPSNMFYPYAAIKTYLMIFTTKDLDEIVLRKYRAKGNSKNNEYEALEIIQDDLLFKSELDELSTWNIDIINAENDEELKAYLQSEHKKVELTDYAELFRGKAVKLKDPNGNIGIINISNINELGIDYSNLDYIDETERKVSRYLLKEGDILISSRGTILRVAIFEAQVFPCIPSSNLIVIRTGKGLHGKYLKIFLESSIGIKLIQSIQRGTSVVNINYKDLGQLEIPMLTLEKQIEVIAKYEDEMYQYKASIELAEERWQKAKRDILRRLL